MGPVNSDSIMNVSVDDSSNHLGQNGLVDRNLEAYTVVLSAAAHVVSTIFGGSSSIAVIIAITSRTNIKKCSYAHVLTLFVTCCCLNFIWSPMEVIDLTMYHHTHTHPFESFVAIKAYIYLFIVLIISLIIMFLSVEGIMRLKNCFGTILKKIWPATSSVAAIICSAFLTSGLVIKCLQSADISTFSYVIVHKDMRFLFLVLTALSFCIVTAVLVILFLFITKDAIYCDNGRLHLKQNKLKLKIPEFLISQSNACADNDGGFEHSQSGTPSPSTPKLLSVGSSDTASIKGEDVGPISELPSPIIKPMGSRLGINMAQVLGRRRHTICQISDSSSGASTSADPTPKAKQYNYVRKFSVDISALQAQLQNPKIFKDAPFQSDIDISKKPTTDQFQVPKPLLITNPLTDKCNDKDENASEKGKTEIVCGGTGTSPPPVITVSVDDAPPSTVERDIPNDVQSFNGTFHEQTTLNDNVGYTVIHKPTSLTLKESAEEHFSAATVESAASDPSETESDDRKMARLTLLLCLTFVLNMLPLLVTEVLQSKLSLHAFINIYTCTAAVSSIQTIVYPHLITCCDDVIHRAVQKLKKRTKYMCACRGDLDIHSQAEESSSTSQV